MRVKMRQRSCIRPTFLLISKSGSSYVQNHSGENHVYSFQNEREMEKHKFLVIFKGCKEIINGS